MKLSRTFSVSVKLSNDEKNMLLIGKIMVCTSNGATKRGKERKRASHAFAFDHRAVCRTCFCLLHDISVKKLKNLKTHMVKNGFSTSVHGHCGRKSNRA